MRTIEFKVCGEHDCMSAETPLATFSVDQIQFVERVWNGCEWLVYVHTANTRVLVDEPYESVLSRIETVSRIDTVSRDNTSNAYGPLVARSLLDSERRVTARLNDELTEANRRIAELEQIKDGDDASLSLHFLLMEERDKLKKRLAWLEREQDALQQKCDAFSQRKQLTVDAIDQARKAIAGDDR